MSKAPIPPRPRLAAHVLARRHVIDGAEQVILHDQERDDVLQIGRREWGVLAAADGTRELEGIVVAARREGAHAKVEAVRELLQTLAGRGMLEAGDSAQPQAARDDASSDQAWAKAPAERPARPLVPQPGGDLACNGAGTCCRLYGTVMMSPAEFRRVQVVLPRWRVGAVPPERWTTPVRGSEPTPALASIARDGACGFLQDDGLCAVHRAGGAEAKPSGCRAFPRIYVDDGAEVHVSFKPECPCVLAPSGGDVEPVIDPAYIDSRSLPETVVVDEIPESIEVRPGRCIPRSQLRRWIAQLAAEPVPADPAATAWALADRMEGEDLPSLDDVTARAAPPEVAAVMPWLEALHGRAARRAREHAAWRSEHDLVRQVSTALALVTRLLLDPDALAEALAIAPEHPDQEARFWRGGLHDYRWPRHGALAHALRDDAIRLWVARSLPAAFAEDDDPDLRAPLALVEAMLRAHGVGAYVDDVTQNE